MLHHTTVDCGWPSGITVFYVWHQVDQCGQGDEWFNHLGEGVMVSGNYHYIVHTHWSFIQREKI